MSVHKLNNSESLKFIFAGKSIVTFLNSETGNRFTFRIKQAKDSNLFFVSVLTSPDIYTYIGTVVGGVYTHGKKSTISKEATSVKVFSYVLSRLKENILPVIIEIWHEGRCGKCGKTLTVPASIATGIGPECARMISKSDKRDKFLELILS